ncbi:OmpA family protein [Niabella yanshanensis]|uniref:OmpA family protein n=1 Tax=Niabella yanshanensis TaxID=577386 RepID=A0ABZ0W062_9BACT|nr:OmpA family protein [Niabella yanshanensis]WQD36592.1 OmpA family protein [Niabella yanshanensis]
MKKIFILLCVLQTLMFAVTAQTNPYGPARNGLGASFRGGYDLLPFYNNNTPYINYKGGFAAGASFNYYWSWLGLGGDFDYIQNSPKSNYPTSAYNSSVLDLKEDKVTRMFYGIGPSFKYQRDEKFAAELFLRGGLTHIKGGYTNLSVVAPAQLLNHHAGYDAKNVLSAKVQAQFSYYFTRSVGLHAGVYYLRHFQTPELTNAKLGFSAAYLPFTGENTGSQPSLVQRNNACNCDISSLGAFAGVSIQLPKKKKQPAPKEECNTCDNYALAITAKDQYTGEILPNTDVVIKNVYGEIIQSGATNNYGVIVFNNIRPDNYSIAGKLFDIDLKGALANKNEFEPNQTLQKEILYADDRFILRGQVVECNVANPLSGASVVLTNTVKAEQKTTNTNDKGAFIFQALQNAAYSVYAKKNDYFSQTEMISTQNFDRNKTLFIKLEVCMEKTDCGKAIILKNIYYDLDKYFIREDAKPELRKLAQFMKDNPGVKVELSSHTDSRASDTYNMNLSQKRADAAVEYLVLQGIQKERLIPMGYGERKLLNRCKDGVDCSEADHQLNRRTEIKVICPDSR